MCASEVDETYESVAIEPMTIVRDVMHNIIAFRL